MNNPKRFLALVPVLSIAIFIALICAVNIFPSPVQKYVPLVSADFRAEMVAQHVPSEAPCLAIFGDSRVAFSINGTSLSRPGCAAVNYGFPALGLPQYLHLANRFFSAGSQPAEFLLSLSVTTFQIGPGYQDGSSIFSRVFWHRMIMSSAPTRFGWFGFERLRYGVRLVLGHGQIASGWQWSSRLGRWESDAIDQRQLALLPSTEKELDDMAVSYTQRPLSISYKNDLLATAETLSKFTTKIVFVIPPVYPGFDAILAGKPQGSVQEFYDGVHEVAKAKAIEVIDCSVASDCNLDEGSFGDPVHLNAAGAEKYSRYLASRMGEIRSN